jgi:hypothetical protein
MPKTRFQLMLEPAQVAALRRIETRTGAPLSVQIRRAVDAWLKTHGEAPSATPRKAVVKAKHA